MCGVDRGARRPSTMVFTPQEAQEVGTECVQRHNTYRTIHTPVTLVDADFHTESPGIIPGQRHLWAFCFAFLQANAATPYSTLLLPTRGVQVALHIRVPYTHAPYSLWGEPLKQCCVQMYLSVCLQVWCCWCCWCCCDGVVCVEKRAREQPRAASRAKQNRISTSVDCPEGVIDQLSLPWVSTAGRAA